MLSDVAILDYQKVVIPRWGFEVWIVLTSHGVYLPMTPFCNRLGVMEYRQIQKTRDDADLGPMCEQLPVPTGRGKRDTWCIKRVGLAAFLQSINPNKLRPDIRESFSQFRMDCIFAMDRTLFGEVSSTLVGEEVAVIQAGLIQHGQFLEGRIDELEHHYHQLLLESEKEVGEGKIICPNCGQEIELKIMGS